MFHHHTGPSAQNVYSTRLTEYQITSGETQRPLRHLLGLIIQEKRPDAIIVLGTCPVEVIGDRFEMVTEDVSRETGVPIAALHTSGLKMTRLVDMQDWLFASLAEMKEGKGAQKPQSFQTIGFMGEQSSFPEFESVIHDLQLTHHGEFPSQSFFSAWETDEVPDKSFVVDATTFPKLISTLTSQGMIAWKFPSR